MPHYELIQRTIFFPYWILYTLLGGVLLCAIVKFLAPFSFVNIFRMIIKSPTSIPFTKEEVRVGGWINWVFLLNFFIVSGLVIYMILLFTGSTYYFFILFPVGYYFLELIGLVFSGFWAGEGRRIKDVLIVHNTGFHFTGLLLLPVTLVWMVNPHWSKTMVVITIILFLGGQLFRIIKGIVTALDNKVLWYYIILYLCTFEIWPIVFIFLIFIPSFKL